MTAGIADKEPEKMSYEEQAAMLIKQAQRIMDKGKKQAQKYGVDDEYVDGDIVFADIQFSQTPSNSMIYKYAFIKAGGKWFSSGPKAFGKAWDWEELLIWFDSVTVRKFGVVTEKREIFRTSRKGVVKFNDA